MDTPGNLGLIAAIAPVVLGVTEAIKRTGISVKWAPFVAMLTGLVFAFLFDYSQEEAFIAGNVAQNAISGVLAGLTAAGLYSGVKTIAS